MREFMVKFRASKEEKDAIGKLAATEGISLSGWIRKELRKAITRAFAKAGLQPPFSDGM